MKDTKVEAAVKIVGNKAEVIMTDGVEPGLHKAVVKDVPKIIAEKPALISYSKADFISTVAVLAASDAEWKLDDILPYAEEICQAAGDLYNGNILAEQEVALKDAIEARAKLRYARIEYMDGDIQYWATDLTHERLSEAMLETHAKGRARVLRPFMEIRYCNIYSYLPDHESHKYVRDLETSEVIHER
ncbi:hypothetical protein PVS_48 [Vibrio phage vB_VspS_VS-ABTNL-3]|nr:hypothetical protein PVS_48 [Vibrio phage vB_VspS_VS-ABTNL-3]